MVLQSSQSATNYGTPKWPETDSAVLSTGLRPPSFRSLQDKSSSPCLQGVNSADQVTAWFSGSPILKSDETSHPLRNKNSSKLLPGTRNWAANLASLPTQHSTDVVSMLCSTSSNSCLTISLTIACFATFSLSTIIFPPQPRRLTLSITQFTECELLSDLNSIITSGSASHSFLLITEHYSSVLLIRKHMNTTSEEYWLSVRASPFLRLWP